MRLSCISKRENSKKLTKTDPFACGGPTLPFCTMCSYFMSYHMISICRRSTTPTLLRLGTVQVNRRIPHFLQTDDYPSPTPLSPGHGSGSKEFSDPKSWFSVKMLRCFIYTTPKSNDSARAVRTASFRRVALQRFVLVPGLSRKTTISSVHLAGIYLSLSRKKASALGLEVRIHVETLAVSFARDSFGLRKGAFDSTLSLSNANSSNLQFFEKSSNQPDWRCMNHIIFSILTSRKKQFLSKNPKTATELGTLQDKGIALCSANSASAKVRISTSSSTSWRLLCQMSRLNWSLLSRTNFYEVDFERSL